MRHGQTTPDLVSPLGVDDELLLAGADMHAYYQARDKHCECDGICSCDDADG